MKDSCFHANTFMPILRIMWMIMRKVMWMIMLIFHFIFYNWMRWTISVFSLVFLRLGRFFTSLVILFMLFIILVLRVIVSAIMMFATSCPMIFSFLIMLFSYVLNIIFFAFLRMFMNFDILWQILWHAFFGTMPVDLLLVRVNFHMTMLLIV